MTKQEELDQYVNELRDELESANYHSECTILLRLVKSLAKHKVPPDVALKLIEDISFWD